MVDFKSAARTLGILCLIALFSISIYVEVSSEIAAASQDKTTGLRDEANTVRSLVIKGNDSFSEQQIRALMRTDVWSIYDETVLESDFEAIISFYRKKGYRFARMDKEHTSVKKFADGVYLGIEIDEGVIGEINLSGNKKTKKDVILRELLFEVGDI